MTPVLGEQLAVFEPYIAFLGEAVNIEDVAVVHLHAFRLPLDLCLSVTGNPDAVASSDCHVPRAADLETSGRFERKQPVRAVVPKHRYAVWADFGDSDSLTLLKPPSVTRTPATRFRFPATASLKSTTMPGS